MLTVGVLSARPKSITLIRDSVFLAKEKIV